MERPLSLVTPGSGTRDVRPAMDATGAGADRVGAVVQRLIEALGEAGDPLPDPGVARPGRGRPRLGLGPVLPALPTGCRHWSVRGLPGVVRAVHAQLTVEIVEFPEAPGAAGVLPAALELLVRRYGGRVHLITRRRPDELEALRDALPPGRELPVSGAPAADTLAGLVERPGSWDLILAPEGTGAQIASTAAALAGVRGLTPAVRTAGDRATAELAPDPENPSGTILALAQLLRVSGRAGIATRLVDAWLCALEERLQPPGLDLVALEARRRSAHAFVEDVVERLGAVPRVLAPSEERGLGARTPHLRLV